MFVLLGVLLIVFFLLVAAIFWLVRLYNSFVQLRVRAENAWSDIDVQLKRRYELIPAIVAAVEGYAAHERTTLQAVVDVRVKAMGQEDVVQKGAAEDLLSSSLITLFGVCENYPSLKANVNFLALQRSLGQIEEEIQRARRYYNAVVRELNIQLELFPNAFLAGLLRFEKKDFFQFEPLARERRPPGAKH